MRPIYYLCGICDHYHPVNWDGDCREDSARFAPHELDERHGAEGWNEIAMDEVDDWRKNNA